jgi:hypothetical protein
VQLLGGDMAVPVFEEQPCQGKSLPRRPQADRAQLG